MAQLRVTGRGFYGRTEILKRISKALESCGEHNGGVIGLCGGPDYGKTAILERCHETLKDRSITIMVRFEREQSPLERLSAIAERARAKGLKTLRYDHVCEAIERALTSKMSGAARTRLLNDALRAFPFLRDSLAVVTAMPSAWRALDRRIDEHFAGMRKWVAQNLPDVDGEAFSNLIDSSDQRLLLEMQALADDIATSEGDERPVLLLIDEFDYAEHEPGLSIAMGSLCLNEAQLWLAVFGRIRGVLLVTAGRELTEDGQSVGIARELIEVKELDHESCLRIVERIESREKRELIVEVCHWNPGAIWAVLDLEAHGQLSISEIESMRSSKLGVVRQRIWHRFTDRTPKELADVVRAAALVPFFNRQILSRICSQLFDTTWRDFTRLSFVRYEEVDMVLPRLRKQDIEDHDQAQVSRTADSDDSEVEEYWSLDDLLRDVVIADYGKSLSEYAEKATRALVKAGEEKEDQLYVGLAISVLALKDETAAVQQLLSIAEKLHSDHKNREILRMLTAVRVRDDISRVQLLYARARSLSAVNNKAEAESDLQAARQLLKDLTTQGHETSPLLASVSLLVGVVRADTGRPQEAERDYTEALATYRRLAERSPEQFEPDVATTLNNLGNLHADTGRPQEAERDYTEALAIRRRLAERSPEQFEP
ncbi:MAG: tetratricopeptide repeat protein, partial [Candidatus Thorarchaeota archaeon]|nr:tetratricopeptide repeat protein [Candidatus Thorarchaeota archaeon]